MVPLESDFRYHIADAGCYETHGIVSLLDWLDLRAKEAGAKAEGERRFFFAYRGNPLEASPIIEIGWLFVKRAIDEVNIRITTANADLRVRVNFSFPFLRAHHSDTASSIPDARQVEPRFLKSPAGLSHWNSVTSWQSSSMPRLALRMPFYLTNIIPRRYEL